MDDLRLRAADPATAPGEAVPTLRELRLRYDLSSGSVTACLRTLSEEGVLVTVPRVGAFFALPTQQRPPTFLLAVEDDLEHSAPLVGTLTRVRSAFERRCAQLGGASLFVGLSRLRDTAYRRGLPAISGVFAWTEEREPLPAWLPTSDVHQVRLASRAPDRAGDAGVPVIDRVDMDQVGGGRAAVEHLVHLGHRRIAFLGLHGRPVDDHHWSRAREQGWQAGLAGTGSAAGPTYLPARQPIRGDDELVAAREPAGRLVAELDDTGVTAVVGANNEAVAALLEALAAGAMHPNRWPAVVGFDTGRDLGNDFVSSIQSPYEEMGRAAATLLWQRHSGQLTGPATARILAMTPIPRLSSHSAWKATLPDTNAVPIPSTTA
ncbi:substrate-binding domain-containing protein [Propionibacteriaceae bacterium Y2011]